MSELTEALESRITYLRTIEERLYVATSRASDPQTLETMVYALAVARMLHADAVSGLAHHRAAQRALMDAGIIASSDARVHT